MMKLGEIKKGLEIGRTNKSDRYQKFIWQACIDCGELRWVEVKNKRAINERCKSCADKKRGFESRREKNPQWGGGIRNGSYIAISLSPDDPFYPMVHKRDKCVYEHRLVMAKELSRCLQTFEIVHHKNGDKKDNRIENLELLSSRSKHMSEHISGYTKGYQKGLEDGYRNGFENAMGVNYGNSS